MCTKTYCCVHSSRHKHSPYQRVRIERFKFWFVLVAAGLPALAFGFTYGCPTRELDAALFWFEYLAAGFTARAIRLKSFDWMLLNVSGQPDELELCSVEDAATVFETKFVVGLDFATIHSSPAPVSFRHRLRAAVEQTEETVPLITCEVTFCHVSMSASWFLVSTYLIWTVGSKLILSNNLSSATLWVLDTCLIVGLRPLMIILITVSLSSKHIQQSFLLLRLYVWGNKINIFQVIDQQSMASKWEGFAPVTTWSTLDNSSFSQLPCFLRSAMDVGVLALTLFSRLVSQCGNVDLISRLVSQCRNVVRKMQYVCHQIPKIKRGYSVHAWTSIRWDNFRFWWTVTLKFVSYTSSLRERMFHFRRYTRYPRSRFRVFKLSSKVESWNNPNRQCCAVVPTWR